MSQSIGYILIKCPFCEQKVAQLTLENHIRFNHPDAYEFFVSDELLNDPSSLADICQICDTRVRNIIAHTRQRHPDQYHFIFHFPGDEEE